MVKIDCIVREFCVKGQRRCNALGVGKFHGSDFNGWKRLCSVQFKTDHERKDQFTASPEWHAETLRSASHRPPDHWSNAHYTHSVTLGTGAL